MIEIIKATVVTILLAGGAFFMLTSAIGLLRFPDVFSRMQATGKCDTMGIFLMLLGLSIFQGFDLVTVKMLFILFFIMFTGPVSIHCLFRAAIVREHKVWTKEGWKLWTKEELK